MSSIGNDVRADVLKVEARDLGQRMTNLSPEERAAVIDALHAGAHFCWVCGNDYIDPSRATCNCMRDE